MQQSMYNETTRGAAMDLVFFRVMLFEFIAFTGSLSLEDKLHVLVAIFYV